MRYLALAEVVDLHRRLLEATGGAAGIRDLGALESAGGRGLPRDR
jgi:death-on-curing protein